MKKQKQQHSSAINLYYNLHNLLIYFDMYVLLYLFITSELKQALRLGLAKKRLKRHLCYFKHILQRIFLCIILQLFSSLIIGLTSKSLLHTNNNKESLESQFKTSLNEKLKKRFCFFATTYRFVMSPRKSFVYGQYLLYPLQFVLHINFVILLNIQYVFPFLQQYSNVHLQRHFGSSFTHR